MRRLIEFDCAGETLFGSFDDAPGTTGLLIVSGGNEIRSGAHRGMALLAADVATLGHPVFRFDRRGVGDSTGNNGGFRASAPDVMAAVAAFRASAPHISRLVGFGNCDAATALLLHGSASFDRLLLANPWTSEDGEPLPPTAAIRARYADRLRDPGSWARLLTGRVDFSKLFGGLAKIARRETTILTPLETDACAAIIAHPHVTILLASGDRTAIAFADLARRAALDVETQTIDTASHSFAQPADKVALRDAVLAALR